jgi:hypothetical protein
MKWDINLICNYSLATDQLRVRSTWLSSLNKFWETLLLYFYVHWILLSNQLSFTSVPVFDTRQDSHSRFWIYYELTPFYCQHVTSLLILTCWLMQNVSYLMVSLTKNMTNRYYNINFVDSKTTSPMLQTTHLQDSY